MALAAFHLSRYVRAAFLLWATRPPGKDIRGECTEQDLLVALQTSPIANFCKDTGDFYAASWRPFAAWQVWDLGRLMAGHRSGDLHDAVDVIEADVARREPAFFLMSTPLIDAKYSA